MSPLPTDVVDHLAGIEPGSRLHEVRNARIQARENAQASFLALFRPAEPGAMSLAERAGLALFVAGLHRAEAVAAFYGDLLAAEPDGAALRASIEAESGGAAAQGPAGRYPDGPLAPESLAFAAYRPSAEARAELGERLAAAFAHAHLLVFRPRESSPEALGALLEAGWSTTGIVTLSQLVAFLAFQIRLVAGLRALSAAPAEPTPAEAHA